MHCRVVVDVPVLGRHEHKHTKGHMTAVVNRKVVLPGDEQCALQSCIKEQ
jgi:hypothetical protein